MRPEISAISEREQLQALVSQLYQGSPEVAQLLHRLAQASEPKSALTSLLLCSYMNYLGDGTRAESYARDGFRRDPKLATILLPKSSPNHDATVSDSYPMVKVDQCPVCGSATREQIYVGTTIGHPCYHEGLAPYLCWVQCKNCPHVYAKEQNRIEILFGGPKRSTDHALDQGDQRYENDYNSISHLAKMKPGGRTLEIGVGNGTRMAALRDLGLIVTGIELQPEVASRFTQLGFNIEVGDFIDHEPSDGFTGYDVVVVGDVIEHLPDLQAGMTKLANLTLSGGLLWISTPIFDNFVLEQRRRTGTDPYFHELEHWHYFCRASLLHLMNQHGFQLLSQGFSRTFIGSVEFTFSKARDPLVQAND